MGEEARRSCFAQIAQRSDRPRDVMVLEQPDRRNSGGAGLHAQLCILQSNPADGEHGNSIPAHIVQRAQARRRDTGLCRLFKHCSEDREIGLLGSRTLHFGAGMAGH